ncbi:MAG: hypothetical protein RIS35_3798 [Pseudomonadota bacterium]
MADILLTTINARYQHASLGLRYLLANLGPLAARAELLEFVSGARTENVVERILARRPRIVGLGVYIWNVDECTRLVAQLRRVAPDVVIVVGGPEVSHEVDEQRICRLAHHVVTGPGEVAFAKLCAQLLDGPRPLSKVLPGGSPAPETLALPYALYDDEDLRNRFVYVEASRGCPFRCEFCLSSLDRTAEAFDLDRFLGQMAALHARGARVFKFVDRTFNLKIATSLRILEFFLEHLERTPDDPVFAHFELVPDHLPERLRDVIRRFPLGTLQFEIGIQTWNPEVQALISRRQDNAKAAGNIAWLVAQTHAHLHVDLIAGLPGEDLASFGAGFDRLVALRPHEIQLGILKRLRGAPIARHTEAFGMVYSPDPPYNVLATDRIPFTDLQRVGRFARYWDLFANSGRFRRTVPLLLGDRPFERFMAFSDWLFGRTDATHRLALERQYELALEWLGAGASACGFADALRRAEAAIRDDYLDSGARGRPAFLARGSDGLVRSATATPTRQSRHL